MQIYNPNEGSEGLLSPADEAEVRGHVLGFLFLLNLVAPHCGLSKFPILLAYAAHQVASTLNYDAISDIHYDIECNDRYICCQTQQCISASSPVVSTLQCTDAASQCTICVLSCPATGELIEVCLREDCCRF